jgi:hypothetical protein
MNPTITAGIRAGMRNLDALGDVGQAHADYWCQELHHISGYPIEARWNSKTLAQIERDVEILSRES